MADAEIDWGFEGADDARRYLGEVARLWGAWIAGLVGLVAVNNLAVVAVGVVVIGLLLWLARPLQVRAAKVVPEDTLVGGRFGVVGKGTVRDRVLRQFAYGDQPLRQAVDLSGASSLWLWARQGVVAATIIAFVAVLFLWFDGSPDE
jgi:hypothetical protein